MHTLCPTITFTRTFRELQRTGAQAVAKKLGIVIHTQTNTSVQQTLPPEALLDIAERPNTLLIPCPSLQRRLPALAKLPSSQASNHLAQSERDLMSLLKHPTFTMLALPPSVFLAAPLCTSW